MWTAIWRKLRADIGNYKFQFFLILTVLTLSAMLLTISLLVMGSANEPWERTFEETNGPHVWLVSGRHDLDFTPVTDLASVTETTGKMLSLAEHPLVLGDEKLPIFLYAMGERPSVAHPKVAAGRWLEPDARGEIVLDYSLAQFYAFEVGDEVEVLGADGIRKLKVVGLAITAHWFPYNDITKDVSPGVAYISSPTLIEIEPDPAYWYSVMGLRLDDPETSQDFVDQAHELLLGDIRLGIEWQWVKELATYANNLNVLFLGFFSLLGLAAVGLIIANTIGGQVLSQFREIGFLKAIGFKPEQVTFLFLAEHLVIGLIAAVIGIGAGVVLAPGIISSIAENLNTTPPNPFSPGPLVAVFLLIEGAVAFFTLLPAWQGGRIDTVQAITVGYRRRHRRSSWMARAAGLLRLPTVVVLGVKDTFSRPSRSALTLAGLVVTVVIAITSISAVGTGDLLSKSRVYFNGTSADMKVERNFVSLEDIQSEILDDPQVAGYYEELMLYGFAPGKSDTPIFYRLLSGDYEEFDFQIQEGRMIEAPGEAVVGHAILTLLDAEVGDTVSLLVEGSPVEVTLVGRHLEGTNVGNVVVMSMETYRQQVDTNVFPLVYNLRLVDRSAAEDLRKEWIDHFQNLVNVSLVTEEPQASMMQLIGVITGLGALMMVVAGVNLLSASLLSVRERVRDFGIQKTLGLTPAQIAGSVMVGAVTLALIALVVGVPLGVWLMDIFIGQLGVQIGLGPDFYVIDWTLMSVLLPVMALLAVVSSAIPAYRASQLEVSDALRYE